MSFLGGVSDLFGRAASYASQQAEAVKNLTTEDVVAAARRVSDASVNALRQIQCSCFDWALLPEAGEEEDEAPLVEEHREEEGPEQVAEVELEEGVSVGEVEIEPGWEQVADPKDELADPYPAADAGVKRRKKKKDD